MLRLRTAIQLAQTDHGNEFGTDFTWHPRELGSAHRRIPPEVNGKVERSHHTDGKAFYRRTTFDGRRSAKLRRWEYEYNHRCPISPSPPIDTVTSTP